MYRLLIVDDDEILRSGLASNIDWNSHGIQVVAQAKNGKEAVEMIERTMPEIVLSDIRMPFMDGIELAKYVSEYFPRIKMILLSAYEEFSYAKKAIQYRVYDYVMKYESNDVILEKVCGMITQCRIDREHEDIRQENKSYLLRDYIQQLCLNEYENTMELYEDRPIDLFNGFGDGRYIVLSFAMETYNSKRESRIVCTKHDGNIMHYIMEFMKERQMQSVCFQDKESVKVVVNIKDRVSFTIEKFQQQLEQLAHRMEEENPLNMYISGGSICEELTQLHNSYLGAEETMSVLKLMDRTKTDTRVMLSGTAKSKQENMADVMEKIVQFIQNNYDNPELSLNQISKYVYLSPAYVSTIFKKYKEVTISNYIIDVRMRTAEKLLKESSYKAYEIANMVGYTNSQYFSILFKKYRGVSPSEYRQMS